MFDSKYTDFKVTNTAIGRDLVKEFVEAFRAEGLRVGLYYSLLDWNYPDYTIDNKHPHYKDPDAAEQNKSRDFSKYTEYMRNQVTELLTNYGKIDILWFDFSWRTDAGPEVTDPLLRGKDEEDWESERLLALRAEQEHFISPSFDTICAYGPNAAMMHYKAGKNSCAKIFPMTTAMAC